MTDESQGNTEARLGQETAVLRVCNLPYLAQDIGSDSGLFKELDGDLSCDDSQTLLVCLGKEGSKVLLLLG